MPKAGGHGPGRAVGIAGEHPVLAQGRGSVFALGQRHDLAQEEVLMAPESLGPGEKADEVFLRAQLHIADIDAGPGRHHHYRLNLAIEDESLDQPRVVGAESPIGGIDHRVAAAGLETRRQVDRHAADGVQMLAGDAGMDQPACQLWRKGRFGGRLRSPVDA
ncbi:MAG TPA: hypothetical protein VF559_10585 [Caulobacteraceae bacterium]